ncbi:hypothetical protein RN001_011868 [Aquatica leii]|uniref:MSP domain-containing protein n=1 Tax=Aquatica leii TaxID=1421715 RepID=A0AAN7S7K2_9COLE|nr:hypothetical protein RN001_011868 [Aquatica leii]
MFHVPLIPKTKESKNFDVSHVLQEAFQDFIDPDEFYENVTRNVSKFNLKNANLSRTGEEVIAVYDGTKLCMDDITHTEHQLMVSQAKYLKREDEINNDSVLRENIKLTRPTIFQQLDAHDIDKHHLLQKKDLLPSKAEAAMDFSMTSNEHLCEPPCEALSEIFEVIDTDENCIREPSQLQVTKKKSRRPKLEVIFKAEPKELEFLEYCLGVTYEKRFKLRNITNCTRTFIPYVLPHGSPFEVKLHWGVTRVASGMFVIFSVKYRPDVYKDVEEKMRINTFTGEDVVVTFKSYRTPPRLVAYIYKNLEHLREKCPTIYDSDYEFSEERQLALNSSIDCGGCFVGTELEATIIFRNPGNELILGAFAIHPTYFEIKRDEFIELRITFISKEFGLAVEKLFLLCDNNTVEELEIVADGVLFDKTSVVIDPQLTSKGHELETFDAKCAFVINYKKCHPHYEYIRFITVQNNSCLNYDYKWVVRSTVSHVEGIMFEKLETEWLLIRNAQPRLHSNSTTDFELVLRCPDNITGIYSLVLILHVLNIPEASLAEDTSFCVLQKTDDDQSVIDDCQFDVHVKVIKPKARFLTNYLCFGIIPRGHRVSPKKVYIQNTGLETIEWSILECSYNFTERKVIYFDSLKHLSANKGLLFPGDTITVTYTIDSPSVHCRWVSFLILISIHPMQMAMDSICIITYEVAEPNVKVHSALSKFPLIIPQNLLYLSCETHYQLCVHNIAKNICGAFMFGSPRGEQANALSVTFDPRSGIVGPKKCIHVMMTITPLQTGVIDDFQVPCNIECTDNPIMLTFMCVVDNINLNYYLPDAQGKFTKIFWPVHVVSNPSESFLNMVNKTTNDASRLILDSCDTNEIFRHTSLDKLDTPNDSFDDLEIPSSSKLNIESQESIVVKSPSNATLSEISLKDYFSGHLELYEHSIEFRSVPLRTPVKKTIMIENVTPILGNYTMNSTNFYPMYSANTRESLFQQMLEDINIKPKSDEWEKLVNTEYGIMIKFSPTYGSVSSMDIIDIDIWVYANTWGAYIEEVIINVNDVKPFYFNLIIEAVGIPIEYPISLNSILNETVVRFGSFSYSSEPTTRALKIKNYGCIPLHIVWHTFLLGGQPTNFNLIMETFDHSSTSTSTNTTEMSMKLLITNKYHGIQDNLIFQVSPVSIKLRPKATKELRITFDPKTISPKFEKTELEGALVGHIHLKNKYKFQSNVFVRKTDIEIGPTKVKLLVALELPILQLQLLQGDLKIGAYANDIIEAQEIRYERNLIFRNTHQPRAEVSMNINKPFRVVNLTTIHAKTDKEYVAASVPHDYCLHALIECTIDAEQVLQYSDMLFNANTTIFPETVDFADNAVVVKRNLEVFQNAVKTQVLPMEFTIFYPSFEVSQKTVAFGVVFVGNTKKNLLNLYNTTGNAIPFTVHKPPLAKAFDVIPARGVIPKSNGRVTMCFTLNVHFTPR